MTKKCLKFGVHFYTNCLMLWMAHMKNKDQSCVLLYGSQATNIPLMSALALSTPISDTKDGRACHELCVVETIYDFEFTYHFSCKLREIV